MGYFSLVFALPPSNHQPPPSGISHSRPQWPYILFFSTLTKARFALIVSINILYRKPVVVWFYLVLKWML